MISKIWKAIVLGALAVAGPAAAADRPDDVFTVAAVPVDATAANPSLARDAARQLGERRAFDLLIDRLVLAQDRGGVPKATDSALNDIVQGIEVANERSSGVRYLANYTFRFRPESVRRLLRDAGVPFAETPSRPVVVLPVLVADNRTTLWEEPNPWRDAWNAHPPQPGLVPLAMPLGELGDVAAIDAAAAASGDDARLQAIAQRYGGDDVLVAVASLKTATARHTLDVTGRRYTPGSPGGEPKWTTTVAAAADEADPDLMARAIADVVGQMQQAWKVANILDFSQSGTLRATVLAHDLATWLAVRDSLTGIPAVRRTEILSVDHSGAQIVLHYVGAEGQLRVALSQRDLELSGADPDWVLARRGAGPQH